MKTAMKHLPLLPRSSNRSVALAAAVVALAVSGIPLLQAAPRSGAPGKPVGHFRPLATFSVETAPNNGAVAEIVDATPDGKLLIYTDSASGTVGLVDIQDPGQPAGLGAIPMGGEPTSVAITPNGRFALVCVHGDTDKLVVLDLADASNPARVELPLGGQPDCITISSDGRYAAIAIENERDEDVDDGEMPQSPAGFLTIVDLVGAPTQWTTRDVALTGLAERFPADPEPEFIAINEQNIAAVTLQENNHIVLVHLATGAIVNHFSAGTTTHPADLQRNGVISFTDVLANARLEPDAIAWTPQGNLVTANEGDYNLDLADGEFVGGRNFTIFSPNGALLFDCGAELEMAAAAVGRYPDNRSNSKGTEPEGIEVARFLNHTFLFVGMERAASVAVYQMTGNEAKPKLIQVLPTGARPEGLCAIPQRGLFVTANEDDGTISIFQGYPGNP